MHHRIAERGKGPIAENKTAIGKKLYYLEGI
jgi:hypothetical protein